MKKLKSNITNKACQYTTANGGGTLVKSRPCTLRYVLEASMRILIAVAILVSSSAQSSDELALTDPILSPDEAVSRFKIAMVEKESVDLGKHVLSVVAFSYTSQQWIIHFDCTAEHPEWKDKDCGIHGYIQNNTQHKLLVARNK